MQDAAAANNGATDKVVKLCHCCEENVGTKNSHVRGSFSFSATTVISSSGAREHPLPPPPTPQRHRIHHFLQFHCPFHNLSVHVRAGSQCRRPLPNAPTTPHQPVIPNPHDWILDVGNLCSKHDFLGMQMHATFVLKCGKCRLHMKQSNVMESCTMFMRFFPYFVILILI